MRDVSRRGFLTGAVAIGAGAMLTTVGCAPAKDVRAKEPSEGARVLKGAASGLKSEIKVAVSLSEDGALESVHVLESGDSPFISDAAIEGITRAMVERQSLNVDAVSGATWSSQGIMDAAKNALDEAGVDISPFMGAPTSEVVAGDDVDCDVLVIGGGAAGLCAALAARTDEVMSPGADSGLNVVLVEQLGYTGGCIRVSDCMILALNGTRYNEAVGSQSPTGELIAFTKENDAQGYMNEILFAKVLDGTGPVTRALADRGLYMPVSDALGKTEPVCGLPSALWTVRDPVTGDNAAQVPDANGYVHGSNAGGPYLAQSLEFAALDANVDIRKSTQVEELIVEGSTVTGVKVVDKVNRLAYTIRPKRIILATGCLGAHGERMKKYAPSAEGAVHFGCAGTTGDGIAWVEDAGGVVLDGKVHYQPGPDGRVGHYGKTAILQNYAPCVMVNVEGKRFFNEAERSRAVANKTYIAQPDNKVFGIVSGKAVEQFQDELTFACNRGVAWKADDLAALSGAAGIDADGFASTIEEYRAAYQAGEGVDFDTVHEDMVEIAESGPYYAFLMRTLYNLADIGIKVDESFVPIKDDGAPVFDNVKAAGSVIVSNYGFMTGGFSHMMALVSGTLVGHAVRDELR